MSRSWTDAEIQLLGTKPDADVGRLIGRPGKAVWAKRRALGMSEPGERVSAGEPKAAVDGQEGANL